MIDLEALIASDRAEDLSPELVVALFAGAGGDEAIVHKLTLPGVYLLQGSRGTGKTMLLRVAYERLLRENAGKVLPVFVSFARYLATYSNTSKTSLGYSPFQHWVTAKLLSGMQGMVHTLRKTSSENVFGPVPFDAYTKRLEMHYADATVADPSANAKLLGVSEEDLLSFARLDQIQAKICSILDAHGFDTIAFFLDEAAQNFAEELQPEFFQIIKHLRHHRISIKAAVYPNTTNYGRDFDIGHDAIVLPIDRPIENSEGMALFKELVQKRFAGTTLGKALGKSETPTSFLVKMSGGNPRWFIHLLNHLNHSTSSAITNTEALSVAKDLPGNTLWPYLTNLKKNFPSKRKYVDSAVNLAQIFIEGIKESNKDIKRESLTRPSCYVAVSNHKTVPFRVHAAIKLLQYAGIVSSRGPKKITGRETAEMLLIHPAILARENALYGGETNPPLDSLVSALTDPPREKFREFTRNSPRLLEFRGEDESDTIICGVCSSALPDRARFCMSCGSPTQQTSPYQELLSQPISKLELTPGIRQRIVDDGRFRVIKDIVEASDELLDSIHLIGKTRIKLIRYAAEEFLAG